MIEMADRCRIESWRALDNLSICFFKVGLVKLMEKINECVMGVMKTLLYVLLFWNSSNICILGLLIAISWPAKMNSIIRTIERIAVELILQKQLTLMVTIIAGAGVSLGGTMVLGAFLVGVNKGLQLHRLTHNERAPRLST